MLLGFYDFHDIPLTNITAVACDGAPAMIGRYRGFSPFLTEIVPEVFRVHCAIYSQYLVSKDLNPELHNWLQVCIRTISKISSNKMVIPSSSCFFMQKLDGFQKDFACNDLLN